MFASPPGTWPALPAFPPRLLLPRGLRLGAERLSTPSARTLPLGAPGMGDGDDVATAWLQMLEVMLGTAFPLG